MTVNTTDPTLHLPRILCLHGGGTNARIFKAQCRIISRVLAPYFRFVYAEAPYSSTAGPDVMSVYAEHGPFKRWLRWLPDQPETDDYTAIADIDAMLDAAIDADDLAGATGPFVGILGFSQGAKMAASILFRQQIRASRLGRAHAGSDFKFGVILAGRAPIVNLDPGVFQSSMLVGAGQVGLSRSPDLMELVSGNHILRIPTIHVHGLNDPGLNLHRELLEEYCDPMTTRLVEWSGGHRVPIKGSDVKPLVDQIIDVAKLTGALKRGSHFPESML
ncbi:serine hydrolase FSH [Hypoxylon trugodes]|uniref:serine hydrolase FSH n=1 Tax=Hypoxylon trugodes TaxID=326681 RepID=UPI00218E0CF0|nr:serine hydrolase FSH [Hypoxylon trugodes]KAI1385363.1 serine hydrolase FSH [Hypoxylon trugodes]